MGSNELSRNSLIKTISEKLTELSHAELIHAKHVLNSLSNVNNDSMHYLGRFLGIEHCEDRTTIQLGIQHKNTYGVVQGGVVLTLADVSIGHHILHKLSENEQVYTLELKVNFIKKGTGRILSGQPHIYHWGKSTVVAACKIFDQEDDLIALAQGTFYIQRK